MDCDIRIPDSMHHTKTMLLVEMRYDFIGAAMYVGMSMKSANFLRAGDPQK